MLVPIIVDLAKNHWHKILQESLIALKTIYPQGDRPPCLRGSTQNEPPVEEDLRREARRGR